MPTKNNCAVATCRNYGQNPRSVGISYHSFPCKKPDICRQWVDKCKRKDKFKPENARVCAVHFLPTDFANHKMYSLINEQQPKRCLVQGVVPSLYLDEPAPFPDEMITDTTNSSSTDVVSEDINSLTTRYVKIAPSTTPSFDHGLNHRRDKQINTSLVSDSTTFIPCVYFCVLNPTPSLLSNCETATIPSEKRCNSIVAHNLIPNDAKKFEEIDLTCQSSHDTSLNSSPENNDRDSECELIDVPYRKKLKMGALPSINLGKSESKKSGEEDQDVVIVAEIKANVQNQKSNSCRQRKKRPKRLKEVTVTLEWKSADINLINHDHPYVRPSLIPSTALSIRKENEENIKHPKHASQTLQNKKNVKKTTEIKIAAFEKSTTIKKKSKRKFKNTFNSIKLWVSPKSFRSSDGHKGRKSRKELKMEAEKEMEEAILSQREDGLKIKNFEGKGRGLVTTKFFKRNQYVIEYSGELIDSREAKIREIDYSKDENIGSYMYHFSYLNKNYCIDATTESGRLGRLINHSRNNANLTTKIFPIENVPRLILIAQRDINVGEELLYDYGDRNMTSMLNCPWLAS